MPSFITELTGLTTEDINKEGKKKGEIKAVLKSLIDDNTIVVAHNANFDLGFLYYHFGISPKYFMCTRTIEFFTHPDLPLSLKYVYPRYVEDKQQIHRAGDDVAMTKAVLDNQWELHGDQAMEFFLNKMVQTPERGLVYRPDNAIVLDFKKKFIKNENVK